MSTSEEGSQHQQTLIMVAAGVLDNLAGIYAELPPYKSKDSFYDAPFLAMWKEDGIKGDSFVEDFFSQGDSDLSIYYCLLIPCAYCVEAMKNENSGKSSEAWFLVSEAKYWLGLIKGAMPEKDQTEKNKAHYAFRGLELKEGKRIEGVGKKSRFRRTWKFESRV